MKNIVIPTDFSENSDFAVDYGAEVSSVLKSGITLLHAYNIPLATSETVLESTTVQTWDKENQEMLRGVARKVGARYPGMLIEAKSTPGLAGDVILEEANAEGTDLTIMGSKGTGNIGNTIFGNVSADIIRKVKKPVLIVRPGVVYKPIRRILLACNNDSLVTPHVIHVINEFANANHARLYVLNIIREPGEPVDDAFAEVNKIKDHFKSMDPAVHVMKDEKVVHGINEFAHEYEVDMIVMLPGKHNIFERMFTEIHTEHMVKDAIKPLLVIPQGL